jgi:CubicO group peptidase (beta-lactamase class C family)
MSASSRLPRFVPTLLLVIAATTTAFAPGTAEPGASESANAFAARAMPFIEAELREGGIVGASVIVIDDQQVVWRAGFGFADKARGVAAAPDTLYRAGAISEILTTMAALRLADAGRLDIDKPVAAYIRGFRIRSRFPEGDPIRVRQLMTHHAGLPANVLAGTWSASPEPFEHVAGRLSQEWALSAPGAKLSYSTAGVSLLGHVVEQAGSQPFLHQVNDDLLVKLGMTGSYFASAPVDSPRLSKAYDKRGAEVSDPPTRDVPAAGLLTSVDDLGRLLMTVFARGRNGPRQVLKPAAVESMLTVQNPNVPLDFGLKVGLGWMLSALGEMNIQGAGRVAHHAGSTWNYHGQIVALPEHKIGVAVLANTAGGRQAVDRIAPRLADLALESKSDISQPPPELHAAARFSEQEHQDFVGDWATPVGLAHVAGRGNGELSVDALGHTFSLEPVEGGGARLRYRLLSLIEINLKSLGMLRFRPQHREGRLFLVAESFSQRLLVGEKIAPKPNPDAWTARIGTYSVVAEPGEQPMISSLRLETEGSYLVVRVAYAANPEQTITFVLDAVDDSHAVLAGAGPNSGETIEAVQRQSGAAIKFQGAQFVLGRGARGS